MPKETKKEKEKQKGELAPKSEKGLVNREESLTRSMDSIFNDFRRSFDNILAPFMPFGRSLYDSLEGLPTRYPLCDIVDKGNEYIINVELPGLNKNDVDIQLNKDTLILTAEKKNTEEINEDNYIHRERSYSQIQRVINFPEEVNPENVDGSMEDGIMVLKVAKKEPKPEEKMRKINLK
jgi:HSP20 family protein